MKKGNTISIIFTLLVIAIYLIPNFASALQVDLNKNKYQKTDKIIFNINHIDLKEKITNVTLFVNDNLICESCNYTEIKNFDCEEYGYGYGYGYGCGGNSFEAELNYSFKNLNSGEHSFKIILNSKYSKKGNFKIEKEQSGDGGSSGGGSSGTSGASFTARFQKGKPLDKYLTQNVMSRFNVNGIQHTIKVIEIINNSVTVEIKSNPMIINLIENESKTIEIDNEFLELTLIDIRGRVAIIKFEIVDKIIEIKEEIEEIEWKEEPEDFEDWEEEIEIEEPKEIKEEKRSALFYVLLGIGVLAIIVLIVYYLTRKEEDKKV